MTKEFAAAATMYEQRLRPFAQLSWLEIRPSRQKNTDDLIKDDSTAILSKIQPNDQLILLDQHGKLLTNEAFAVSFAEMAAKQGRLVFVIGGAYGVSPEVVARANFVWSLSNLVFPHQLVQVILLEQLYRTFALQSGHPYHHGE